MCGYVWEMEVSVMYVCMDGSFIYLVYLCTYVCTYVDVRYSALYFICETCRSIACQVFEVSIMAELLEVYGVLHGGR